MRILNARQMREADRRAIEDIGVPSLALMENAGAEVTAVLAGRFDDLAERRVAIVCGRGNNGGDGFVVARLLAQRNVPTSVYLVGRTSDVRGDARANLEKLQGLGVSVAEIGRDRDWEALVPEFARHGLVVDALFGTGLSAPLSGLFKAIVDTVNGLAVPVVSIDLPSGLSADTHELIGPCIRATVTVTLGAPKLPLMLDPAREMAGELVVADIGIPRSVVESLDAPDVRLLTADDLRPLVVARRRDAHKGIFGHVLVVAGSRGKTGAAQLSAYGALRSGAGLVTVAAPRSCQSVIASLGSEYMTDGLAETAHGTLAADALEAVLTFPASVIAAGPGLGSGSGVTAFVTGLIERARVPLVLDADAINACAADRIRLTAREGQTIVVTPHPGEMARLLGIPASQVQAHRLETALTLATTHRLFVALKGHHTIVAAPDGRVCLNPTGNPGMATGGTGDVLTGMIAGWLAQLGDADSACRLGVYLHGAAGDLAARAHGEVSMTAGDLLHCIGDAVLALVAPREGRGL